MVGTIKNIKKSILKELENDAFCPSAQRNWGEGQKS